VQSKPAFAVLPTVLAAGGCFFFTYGDAERMDRSLRVGEFDALVLGLLNGHWLRVLRDRRNLYPAVLLIPRIPHLNKKKVTEKFES
jgi:hypothetical protein